MKVNDHLINVGVIIPARNEQDYLKKTLTSLSNQTHTPAQVIVVNDNSIDETRNIALEFGCEVLDFPYKHESWLGDYKLASVRNLGIVMLDKDLDYILMIDADHILPHDYIETMINKMESKPKVVIASGKIDGEWIVSPRGSGRMIKMFYWKKIGSVYPMNYGFDSYILFKAMQLGYEIEVYPEIITKVQRPTTSNYNTKTFYSYGKSMQALGYPMLYAIGRCLVMSKRKGTSCGMAMFKGLMSNHVEKYEPELREYVKQTHKFTTNHIKRFFEYGFKK